MAEFQPKDRLQQNKAIGRLRQEAHAMPRVDTDRWRRHTAGGFELPVFVLQQPTYDQRGVLMAGDEIMPDMLRAHPGLREQWFVVGMTQSHAVPEIGGPDLWVFTDPSEKGKKKYLASAASRIPFVPDLGDGLYVDTDFFTPDPSVPKTVDLLSVAKWFPTKRTEKILGAAELLPDRSFLLFGFDMPPGRETEISLAYRDIIKEWAAELPNVRVLEPEDHDHKNDDGSIVIGGYTKEMMRLLYQSAQTEALTADINEAANRSLIEASSCDVPILVTSDTVGIAPSLVQFRPDGPKSGLSVAPKCRAIARGIEYILGHPHEFAPRAAITEAAGMENSLKRLRRAITQVANEQGQPIDLGDMRTYRGDVWTRDYYTEVRPTQSPGELVVYNP